MKLIVAATMAFLFMACSVTESKPVKELEIFHPQRTVADTTRIMEEL
jgi:hypothetical protein